MPTATAGSTIPTCCWSTAYRRSSPASAWTAAEAGDRIDRHDEATAARAIDPFTGGRLKQTFFDANRDGRFNDSDMLLVDGVPTIVSGLGMDSSRGRRPDRSP